MHIQDSRRAAATTSDGRNGAGGTVPLRVDAQRNLEHVLRAAREVFGELGYGAPMEDVARRARVGVGTVYRRFPSKDVLVRRIAEEETARLTEQARTALGQENEAWSALARFLRTSAASGAGRLLPPQVLRVQGRPAEEYGTGSDGIVPAGIGAGVNGVGATGGVGGVRSSGVGAGEDVRVPHQRSPLTASAPGPDTSSGEHTGRELAAHEGGFDRQHGAGPDGGPGAEFGTGHDADGIRALLDVVGQLVNRAREAGELRGDVSVADVLLVIATAAPALPDPAQQAAASGRLLDILLDGLRSRPVG
jgi:AcrR family transcriptional regulator